MNFKELSEKIGFEYAVVVFDQAGRLGEINVDDFTLNQWIEVHKYSTPDSDLRKQSMKKILELATTSEKWFHVYVHSISGSDLRKQSIKKILELATTLDKCLKVYEHTISNSDLTKQLMKKIADFIK